VSAVTKVSVTEKHIANGEREDACSCAVALAAIDALTEAHVDFSYLRVGVFGDTDDANPYAGWQVAVRRPDGRWFSAALDRDVVDWIGNFDAEKPVQPFEVELTWEDE
jgi:hypothetical protein